MRRKRFTFMNRVRAEARWATYELALGWLMLANGSPGDFYWAERAQRDELRRRGLIDAFERLTPKGKAARERLRIEEGIPL